MTLEIPTTEMTGVSQNIKVKFTFNWGEKFKDGNAIENPFDFYLDKEYDDHKDDAATIMNAINTDLAGATYSVTIHSNPTGTATAPANN